MNSRWHSYPKVNLVTPQFKVGDYVVIRPGVNSVWSGIMIVTSIGPVKDVTILICDHPSLGKGTFADYELDFVTRSNIVAAITTPYTLIQNKTCTSHQWKLYTGVMRSFEYCEICDEKKDIRSI